MACAEECRVRRWTRYMCYPENRQEMRIKVELEFGGGGDGGQGRSDRVLICVPTYKVKLCNGDFWRFVGGVRVISFYN